MMSKAETTRSFIVEKTAALFNVKGYAGTSLADMTDATGLTKGSIYGNFENKDEVAVAAFDYNLAKISGIIEREMAKVSGAREKLMVYVKVYGDLKSYPFPVGGCPIQNTAIEADDTHPSLKLKAAKAIIDWKGLIVSLINQGKAEKAFKNDTNADQAALTIISMIEGSLMIANVTGKTAYRKTVMDSLADYIGTL